MGWFSRDTPAAVRVAPIVSTTTFPKVTRDASKSYRGPRQLGRRSAHAAASDRLTKNWGTTPLSADTVIDRNQTILVARSREQAQSNDYMKAFLRLVDQNVVGHRGFSLQAQAKLDDGTLDRKANEAIEAWWRKWQRPENCDVTGRRGFRLICKAAVTTAAKDGEFMIREIKGRSAGPMRYALQTLDPQRCPVNYNVEMTVGGGFIRHGIQFSNEGRPLAYFFSTGDTRTTGYAFGGESLDRVPASEIIHGFMEEIEGQRRGLPWASTALWRLHMLSGFENAALTSARTGASIGGFFEWEDGYEPDGDENAVDEELFFEADGGTFQELPPGARVKEFKTQYPTGEFGPFHKAMLRGAGAGMGVAYVSFANDLDGVSFSSIRQGVLDERDHWMDVQEWLIETLVDRCYQSALEVGLLVGQIKAEGRPLQPINIERYRRVFWQGRRWSWVDPQRDITAEVTAKNNMLTAPSDIIRKKGDDPDTVWRTFAADIKAMRDAGIPDEFIMAAVLGVAPGAAKDPPPADDDGDEPPKKKDDTDGES